VKRATFKIQKSAFGVATKPAGLRRLKIRGQRWRIDCSVEVLVPQGGRFFLELKFKVLSFSMISMEPRRPPWR
jgi:hypothetical protein